MVSLEKYTNVKGELTPVLHNVFQKIEKETPLSETFMKGRGVSSREQRPE